MADRLRETLVCPFKLAMRPVLVSCRLQDARNATALFAWWANKVACTGPTAQKRCGGLPTPTNETTTTTYDQVWVVRAGRVSIVSSPVCNCELICRLAGLLSFESWPWLGPRGMRRRAVNEVDGQGGMQCNVRQAGARRPGRSILYTIHNNYVYVWNPKDHK
jgi:hypothetical protein